MVSTLFFLLTLVAVLWILRPLMSRDKHLPIASLSSQSRAEVDEGLLLRQGLADLEADFELGKLDDQEFARMKERLMASR